ncbi:nucleotidyltransferase [Micrococcus luteus]|nr:nucleotidyltransferase [Micrococcus luteus]
MKQSAYFGKFLADRVNLDDTRLGHLDSRVKAIVAELMKDVQLGQHVRRWEKQGSWAQRTIIRPRKNDEFDADILLHLNEVPGWEPKDYLRHTRGALRRSQRYREMVRKKNRCVRIGYANDCHVDVVPTIKLSDGRQVIVNWKDNAFEDTNPQGFTDWLKQQDDITRGNLRKCVRLLKFIRDSKDSFDIPSVILTLLLGKQVTKEGADERYADVPTTLVTLLTDLHLYLQRLPDDGTMPPIHLPKCPGPSLNHRWDDPTKIRNFRLVVGRYAAWASTAHAAADSKAILDGWQTLFGKDFSPDGQLEPRQVSAAAFAKTSGTRHNREVPQEEFIEHKFTFAPTHDAEIIARVLPRTGFRHGLLAVLGFVPKGSRIEFEFRSDAPGPYRVYWKVRNFGSEVGNQWRGHLMEGGYSPHHQEPSAITGKHWIQAYAVQDGKVIAWAHCAVPIR